MADWVSSTSGYLWQNGLAVVPLVLIVAVATRLLPCRPATRHMMWVMVLVWLMAPPMLPGLSNPWADAPASTTQEPAEAQTAELPAVPNRIAPETAPVTQPLARDEISEKNTRRRMGRGESLAAKQPVAPNEPTHAETQRQLVRITPHVSRGRPQTELTEASTHLPALPSPWRTARADAADQSLLAQVPGAAGLPPRSSHDTKPQATGQWGPYCPIPEPVEQVCKAEPLRPRLPLETPRIASRSRDGERNTDHRARRPSPAGLTTIPDTRTTANLPHESDAPTPEPSDLVSDGKAPADGGATWRQWAGVLLRMRDEIALLPPLPTDIWIGGVVVLLLVAAVRVIRFRQLVRNASLPSPGTSSLVSEASRCAGLRRAPEVWMVEGPLSPMVWCVLRPRLLIPTELWSDLDEVGRRAVIMHELAHLRRRDHWVLWIESAVGGLFWWHPLVWWVRRRVHLEAEYCCDAWVTTLLPRTRRAYAEALLRTRQYVGETRPVIPAMGMGISSGRAKRFARRLTMVMTNTTKPGVSIWGVSLVLLLATTGWLASPARSCPDEKAEHKHDCAKAAAGCDKADCPKAEAASCEKASATTVGAPAQTSYERHMAARAMGAPAPAPTPQPVPAPMGQPAAFIPAIAETVAGWATAAHEGEDEDADEDEEDGDDEDEDADEEEDEAEEAEVEALQEQLEALGERLEQLAEQLAATRARSDSADGPRMRARTPRPPQPPRAPRAPRAPQPPTPLPGEGPRAMFAPTPPVEFPKPGQTWADVTDQEMEWRTYHISEGKLEDYTKLMSRPDVPVLVKPGKDSIEIQATQRQHRIINAYLQLIDPSDERASAEPGHGLFGALVGQGLGAGLGLGAGAGCSGDCSKCECAQCKEVKAHRKEAQRIRGEARQMASELRAHAEGEAGRVRAEARERAREVRDRLRQEARKIRVEARNQEEIRRALETEAEALRQQAERMKEKADRARERAQQLRERSNESKEPQGAILEHIDVLERTADTLSEQGAGIEAKIEEVLAYVETVQVDSDALDHHADEVDVRAETIDEIAGSVEHLEAGPELAMSIAQLAHEIETAGGLANCDPSWISALSNLEAVELAQPNADAMKELAEMMRAAELEAARQADEAKVQAEIQEALLKLEREMKERDGESGNDSDGGAQ